MFKCGKPFWAVGCEFCTDEKLLMIVQAYPHGQQTPNCRKTIPRLFHSLCSAAADQTDQFRDSALQGRIQFQLAFDLLDGVDHCGVVPAAKGLSNLGQELSVRSLARYMAICLGKVMFLVLRLDLSSETLME